MALKLSTWGPSANQEMNLPITHTIPLIDISLQILNLNEHAEQISFLSHTIYLIQPDAFVNQKEHNQRHISG